MMSPTPTPSRTNIPQTADQCNNGVPHFEAKGLIIIRAAKTAGIPYRAPNPDAGIQEQRRFYEERATGMAIHQSVYEKREQKLKQKERLLQARQAAEAAGKAGEKQRRAELVEVGRLNERVRTQQSARKTARRRKKNNLGFRQSLASGWKRMRQMLRR